MSTHVDPRSRAGALWAMRARVEREAEGRFRRLARELAEVGADAIVVGLAERAATDEARHHEMCVDLARGFGVEPVRATTVHAVPALRTRIESPSGRVLHEVVAMSCVTETLSAALLVEMRARATDASVRDVVHEVLRDEVAHARLGWAHLAWSKARGDVGWLSPYVPAMLAATVREEIFAVGEEGARGIEGLGGLGRATRREVFVGTMRGVVLPGLQRFGVDTRLAQEWLSEKIGASPQRARAELLGELREHVGER